LYPPKAWHSDIATAVGDTDEALAFWRTVVKQWVGCGYNPCNVNGMLECYKRREIPTVGHKRRNNSSNQAHPFLHKPRPTEAKPTWLISASTGLKFRADEVEGLSDEEYEQFLQRKLQERAQQQEVTHVQAL